MEIYWSPNSVKRDENAVLTVGTFDGIHLGHQFIIEELKRRARDLNAVSTLVTFTPHPKLVLNSSEKSNLKVLTPLEEKLGILRDLKLDRVVIIEFTKEFSNTSPNEFVRKILHDRIGFKEIIIGYDHAFGKNRAGDTDTLKKMAAELNFSVLDLPELKNDAYVLNSTNIRKFLEEGNVKEANKALGRNYFVTGAVMSGDGRGKRLNYPTANISLDSPEKLVPGDGVYAVYVHYESQKFPGMMNIGVRPTFDTLNHTLEVHIFDFNENIYNKKLKIEFVEKIRDEIRFSHATELMNQLDKDKEKTIHILSN